MRRGNKEGKTFSSVGNTTSHEGAGVGQGGPGLPRLAQRGLDPLRCSCPWSPGPRVRAPLSQYSAAAGHLVSAAQFYQKHGTVNGTRVNSSRRFVFLPGWQLVIGGETGTPLPGVTGAPGEVMGLPPGQNTFLVMLMGHLLPQLLQLCYHSETQGRVWKRPVIQCREEKNIKKCLNE